jgi:hypothetical protein
MELISILGDDKENWGQITGLINRGEWDKVILLKTKSSEKYSHSKNPEQITVDSSQSLISLRDEITKKLKSKLTGLEVAVSIASGNGKEHMALFSALLNLPVGIRIAVFTKQGVEFIN